MYSKEEAFNRINQLVEKFSWQINAYKQSNYNETLTRRDFIDPFFEALGWDMNNKTGAWESYREVIHEDKLKIGATTSAPDYSFRLMGGQRLFFVEAKKPSVAVKDDVAPAYQVRLYGWNAKLAISVVTDFEEFAVYDCTKKPFRNDKASKARINYFTYKDYLNDFDFFWNTFSRQQIIKGGLIKFQQSEKKGTATVDKDFLENLDKWRKELAANIYKNNKAITEDDLNFAVQQTIDRIIFLRIAEDRGLEPSFQLKSCLQYDDYYKELFRQFRIADDKYNSGLFHFKKEKDNSKEPDSITGKLVIENKVIKSVISSLYPPESDYLFNVLPVEILGSAYEQFLGKQIIIKGSRATIEEKPEVRKAGGVYYTPQYIVEYIVENTVGKLCEKKTVAEVSKLKIVDPACGSGSFLLGAYQYLLSWHIKYYKENPPAAKQRNAVLTPDGNLTTAEKKRILTNNIYGVDIDRNAVEVTKLSLLLKCMEGETTASVNTQMILFHDRVLPSLENNIKNGNSLIDVDFYDTEFDFGEEKKIKPFNWQQNFPTVFKQGGFDCVIGNPPYIQLSSFSETTEGEKRYLISKYESSMGRLNTFGFFIKKGIDLLEEESLISFIIPNTLITQDYYEELRKMILDNCEIKTIVNFDKLPFKDAVVENVILILKKNKSEPQRANNVTSIIQVDTNLFFIETNQIKQSYFLESPKFSFNKNLNETYASLNNKMHEDAEKLSTFLEVNQAIALKTDRNKWISDIKKGNDYKPLLVGGKNINRYSLNWDGTYLKYDLNGIHSCKREDIFLTQEKIFFRRVSNQLIATLDTKQFYGLHTLVVMNLKPNVEENIRFFLGLFNSSLLNFYYKITFASTKTVFSEIGARQVQELPIKKINSKNKKEKSLHDEIVRLVDTMLQLNKEKQQTNSADKLEQLQQRIQYTDDKINKLVYELYGLTEEEIKIVEGG